MKKFLQSLGAKLQKTLCVLATGGTFIRFAASQLLRLFLKLTFTFFFNWVPRDRIEIQLVCFHKLTAHQTLYKEADEQVGQENQCVYCRLNRESMTIVTS